MMYRFISFFSVFICCITVAAQVNTDSMQRQYSQKTMLPGKGGITMNGMILTKTETKNLMLLSPDATTYFHLYQKMNKPGIILPLIGFAASLTGIVIQKNNRSAGVVLILSGSTMGAAGSIFRGIAGRHLQKAVWSYNRDVLYPVK